MTDSELLQRAQALADDVLYPRALDADRAGDVPVDQLDHLAAAGLHGASVNAAPETVTRLIEILAGGCLTTAFVWAQHLGATAAAQMSDGPVRDFAADLIAGRLRGGVAFAHMLRPDPPLTTATPTADGWIYNGAAPWVTGWGHIDLVLAAARHGDDVVWALIDAEASNTLEVMQPELAVIDASRTVELHYRDHPVPAARVTRVIDRDEWLATYRQGLRNNGSFPLGVAGRCCRLLDRPAFSQRLDELRQALDAASPEAMPRARADAALFAVQAATALVAATGGRAVTRGEHAQRLYREAMFLLVQGQTPQIKAHMLEALTPESR